MNRAIIEIIFALVAILGAYLYISNLKNEIKDLELEIAQLNSKYATKNIELERLENVIATQNKAIAELKANEKEHLAKLEEWKNKPAKIKYKYIRETIPEKKSNDCEDIKAVIDNVRKLDFSRM